MSTKRFSSSLLFNQTCKIQLSIRYNCTKNKKAILVILIGGWKSSFMCHNHCTLYFMKYNVTPPTCPAIQRSVQQMLAPMAQIWK